MRAEVERNGRMVRPGFNYSENRTIEGAICQLIESLRNLAEIEWDRQNRALEQIERILSRMDRRMAKFSLPINKVRK